MEEVGCLEAGEGGADDDLAVLVDDQAGGAAGVLALEAGAGCGVGWDVDCFGFDAGVAGLVEGLADGGYLGVGESDPRRADSFGGGFDLAAATQAWYLPMWVKRARPVTSPTA